MASECQRSPASWVWHRPIISMPRRLIEDWKPKATLGYIVRLFQETKPQQEPDRAPRAGANKACYPRGIFIVFYSWLCGSQIHLKANYNFFTPKWYVHLNKNSSNLRSYRKSLSCSENKYGVFSEGMLSILKNIYTSLGRGALNRWWKRTLPSASPAKMLHGTMR